MLYRLAANAVLLFHLAFILFVVFGALAVAHWRWLVLVHLPLAAWGFLVEFAGLDCPLTSAENYLRMGAGQAEFAGGFIEHYLLSLIYPAGLTRHGQSVLGAAVLVINGALYAWLFRASRRTRAASAVRRNCPPAGMPKTGVRRAAARVRGSIVHAVRHRKT